MISRLLNVKILMISTKPCSQLICHVAIKWIIHLAWLKIEKLLFFFSKSNHLNMYHWLIRQLIRQLGLEWLFFVYMKPFCKDCIWPIAYRPSLAGLAICISFMRMNGRQVGSLKPRPRRVSKPHIGVSVHQPPWPIYMIMQFRFFYFAIRSIGKYWNNSCCCFFIFLISQKLFKHFR